MCRLIAGDPHLMKVVGHFGRQHALEFQAAKQIGLRLIRDGEQPGFRGCELGQQFAELAKLDQRRIGIVKIAFGQRAESDKSRIMLV